MARGTWSTQKWNGSAWVAETALYRPNENIGIEKLSTSAKLRLADGSSAFFTPETKYNQEPITMQFLMIENSDTFWSRLEGYVTANTQLKITDHLGNIWTGFFASVRRVWIAGTDNQYDLEATFEVIE